MELTKKPAGNVAPGANAEPPANPAEGAEASAPITMAALEKFNSDIRAELGRKTKALEDMLAKATTTPKAEEAATENQVAQTLKARIERFEAKESRQQEKAVRMSIRQALVDAGADSELAAMVVPAVLEGERKNIMVEETQFGDYAIKYGDGSATLNDWAKSYLGTDTGKRLMARRSAHSTGGNMPAGSPSIRPGMREVPTSQAKFLTDAELRSGKISLPSG